MLRLFLLFSLAVKTVCCAFKSEMLPVFLLCLASIAGGYPVDDASNQYTILYDGPDGRHVQMGEPGKRVTGYFTSRSLDGQEEYRTDYIADEKGYRPVGEHLPAKVAKFRSEDEASPYVFNYDSNGQSHYQTGEPGKAVEGSFIFYDAEGRSHRVDYIADEKGYRIKSVDDAETNGEEKESIEVVSTRQSEEGEASAPETDSVIYAVESPGPSTQSDETAKESDSEIPAQQAQGTYSGHESPNEPVGMPDQPGLESDVQVEKEAAAEPREKKPVEESLSSDVTALEPVDVTQAEQTQKQVEPLEEPKQEDASKASVSHANTKEHVSNQPESEKISAELKSAYEDYDAALRSALGSSFKDEKHAFNYPFYSVFAPAFYAQQRRYPSGYYPYHYPSYSPVGFGHQYPYRFSPYYFY